MDKKLKQFRITLDYSDKYPNTPYVFHFEIDTGEILTDISGRSKTIEGAFLQARTLLENFLKDNEEEI